MHKFSVDFSHFIFLIRFLGKKTIYKKINKIFLKISAAKKRKRLRKRNIIRPVEKNSMKNFS